MARAKRDRGCFFQGNFYFLRLAFILTLLDFFLLINSIGKPTSKFSKKKKKPESLVLVTIGEPFHEKGSAADPRFFWEISLNKVDFRGMLISFSPFWKVCT